MAKSQIIILLLSDLQPSSTSWDLVAGFRLTGQTTVIPINNRHLRLIHDRLSCLLQRFHVISLITLLIGTIQFVICFVFSLATIPYLSAIVLDKGTLIPASWLDLLRIKGTKIVFFTRDSILNHRVHGNRTFQLANSSDLFLYHKPWERSSLAAKISTLTLYFPHCSVTSNLPRIPFHQRRGVLFVGEYEYKRASMLAYLSHSVPELIVRGPGWSRDNISAHNFFQDCSIKEGFFNRASYLELARRSLICLSFMRLESKDQFTDRPIELINHGCFVISEYSSFQDRLFESFRYLPSFSDERTLLKIVKLFLQDPHRTDIIRDRALQHSMNLQLNTTSLASYVLELLFT
jgi:hypothetical protein